jgi:hypothetical protein
MADYIVAAESKRVSPQLPKAAFVEGFWFRLLACCFVPYASKEA